MTTTATRPAARTEELEFLGSRVRILAGEHDGDGRLGLVDLVEVPAGHMPPLHVHHSEDEGFYFLAGEVTLTCPARRSSAVPATSYSPRAASRTPTGSATGRRAGS